MSQPSPKYVHASEHQTHILAVIPSRGRLEQLRRLVRELTLYFEPVVRNLGYHFWISVYAQEYPPDELKLPDRTLLTHAKPPKTMGSLALESYQRGKELWIRQSRRPNDELKMVILMDDDSSFYPCMATAYNLRTALQNFIQKRHICYSIKLGNGIVLASLPFVTDFHPFMPHKEKMMWMRPDILEATFRLSGFADITAGEDALIAAGAWLTDPNLCQSIYGITGFTHLAYEAHLIGEKPLDSHLDSMVGSKYPSDIYPEVFVGADNPLVGYNGVKPEFIRGHITNGGTTPHFDLGWTSEPWKS